MLKKGLGLGLASMLVASVPVQSQTSDAVTYTYDALGRLVQTSHSGTANTGVNSTYSYDPADNRTNVTVSGASGGGNQPPITQNDFGGMIGRCSEAYVNVVANDNDPEGHHPLTLVSIQSVSPQTHGSAWVASGTNVGFGTGWYTGSVQITYVVQDSQGATSTGVLSFDIAGGSC